MWSPAVRHDERPTMDDYLNHVDHMVKTGGIDHVAFASLDKFDGEHMRALRPQELAQIAGRAGRYRDDGTFGVTGDAREIDASTVEEIENHHFEPVKLAQWRNPKLAFHSLSGLIESLEATPTQRGLARVRAQIDLNTLRLCANDAEITSLATSPDGVRRLWEACQIPDFRKATPDEHKRWQALAAAQGLTLADLIRQSLAASTVGRTPRRRRMKAPEADPALLAALARAGNNLNQIGRWANTYKSNADAVQVLAALVGIEQILSSYRPGVSGAEPLTEGGE